MENIKVRQWMTLTGYESWHHSGHCEIGDFTKISVLLGNRSESKIEGRLDSQMTTQEHEHSTPSQTIEILIAYDTNDQQ